MARDDDRDGVMGDGAADGLGGHRGRYKVGDRIKSISFRDAFRLTSVLRGIDLPTGGLRSGEDFCTAAY